MSSLYPLWIEKLIFVGLIALAVCAGMALQHHFSQINLMLSWVCILPLIVLVLTEGIGRMIQSIHSK
jgi:hypothetical protein